MDDDGKSKKRGRPPSKDLESIQIRAWFWYIAVRFNTESGYTVERFFRPNYAYRLNKDGDPIKTGGYVKHLNGENKPKPKKIAAIEQIVSGSAAWLDHPLWKLLQVPLIHIQQVNEILSNLRPEIAGLIFKLYPESGQTPDRKHNPENLESELYQYSDIDTFMLCIGLMVEAKHHNRMVAYCDAAKMAHSIFCRVITEHPLIFVADDLFHHLKTYFYSELEDIDRSWYKSIMNFDLSERIIQNAIVVYMIDKFNLRKLNLASLPSCIYLAEQHLYPETIDYLWKHILNKDIDDPRANPAIEEIYIDISKWEQKLQSR